MLALVARAACAFAAVACLALAPAPPAYADGGVHLVEIFGVTDTKQPTTRPNGLDNMLVAFDKNVSYARYGEDPSFIYDNLGKISVRRVFDGAEVPVTVTHPGPSGEYWNGTWTTTGDQNMRRYIQVAYDEWLLPLTEYEVVVAPGVKAANGVDVTEEEYVVRYRTGALCPNGMSLYQNVGIPLFVVLLVAGAIVQARRVRRQRA